MLTMSLRNRKLLSAEDLMEENETLGAAMDVFMIDNVLNNCAERMFDKEYMRRLDLHVRQHYPEIPDMDEAANFDNAVRDIYMEREEEWENSLREIKCLQYDKIGILYHLARKERPALSFAQYIKELM